MKWDMTKVVEEIVTRWKENEEEFIFETIHPYCEDILQLKINKEELKQIILRGSRPNGKWIPVSERLPEYKKPLLVTYKHYEEYKVAIAHIVEDGFYVTDRETALFNVVAWMPLPEPYKEVEDETNN